MKKNDFRCDQTDVLVEEKLLLTNPCTLVFFLGILFHSAHCSEAFYSRIAGYVNRKLFSIHHKNIHL